ncbi:MAG: hypothetical protein ACD_38C00186G0005 [uncultured bacterium]|uniref:DUF378 domain-containing protein n=1 Tax=Candidatus Daviesbacteria bacterium GW2011_GWC2_40_12 TaxID=1618431 RepID=A0A0G0QUN9_9BACT|nr:MAG: hypothetical protein ACD_38C00186G0005 [uncultured bacterium]KKQ82708.1 MAG: hypothetical protein UT04_C0050G0006 [Candidatus Daviesbacteria bacterium GW2011_GWF2_38_7]KKR16736.1 MAG: hypothetical protein UT45_C0004G0067 [Candidatus Daviesbacteria bacterium GW2011_GWA2_39_33]KKR23824.1 MAG: hypothetical protein UT54_C0038G0004 [Candidatus Daviesbacteria bacterium GW2011_GWB1_39_5]KKR41081.1 MAG: hypothetical protein UT77_C0016G0035 [Candidatus Daviesbacteria bacterium GW2011_GWC2_40_12]
MDTKQLIAWILVIGAVNWGLVGLVNMNIVETIFGASIITKIVYIIIGLAGVYKAYMMVGGKKK